jgi:hypothetical protein
LASTIGRRTHPPRCTSAIAQSGSRCWNR